MGNDGGTKTLQRSLVVQLKKSNLNSNWREKKNHFWTMCTFSNLPLNSKSVVCCRKGFLYDKEVILKALLDRTFLKNGKDVKEKFGHIRKLTDVANVNFSVNPDCDDDVDFQEKTKWLCAISQKPIQGSQKCILLRNCGHVVNEASWSDPLLNPNDMEISKMDTFHATSTINGHDSSNQDNNVAQDEIVESISDSMSSSLPTPVSKSIPELKDVLLYQGNDNKDDLHNANHEAKCLICGTSYNIKTDITILCPNLSSFERNMMLGASRKRKRKDNGIEKAAKNAKLNV